MLNGDEKKEEKCEEMKRWNGGIQEQREERGEEKR